jgi:hypothetical protein
MDQPTTDLVHTTMGAPIMATGMDTREVTTMATTDPTGATGFTTVTDFMVDAIVTGTTNLDLTSVTPGKS